MRLALLALAAGVIGVGLSGCMTAQRALTDEPVEGCFVLVSDGGIQGRWTSTDYRGCKVTIAGENCELSLTDFEISYEQGGCKVRRVYGDGQPPEL